MNDDISKKTRDDALEFSVKPNHTIHKSSPLFVKIDQREINNRIHFMNNALQNT